MSTELLTVEIAKSGTLVEVTETYAVTQKSGRGFYPQEGTGSVTGKVIYNVYQLANISTGAVEDTVTMKSNTGSIHQWDYTLVSGVSGADAQAIALAIMS